MKKYVIGLDFGTLSGRCVIADVQSGDIIAESSMPYAHGVMEKAMEDGTPLPEGYALADIHDYTTALKETLRDAFRKSGAGQEQIIGIGIDVTSATFLPVDRDGQPLCDDPAFSKDPHAWMKLWKHHGAQEMADRITELMNERNEPFADRAGRKVNAEWMLPKLLEILEKSPEVYEHTANFMECGDYLVYTLTNKVTRSLGPWGYKMIRSAEDEDRTAFYEALNPAFKNVEEKTGGTILPLGGRAGLLTEEAAMELGLLAGIPVASANIDAHVSVPAAGITGAGKMLAIIGTTCCAVVMDKAERFVPGISGCVKDGVMPGFYGYEAGQSAIGDMFAWFTENGVSGQFKATAEGKGISVQQYLTELAGKKKPGASGLVALDWWNGNRSHLADADLSGMIAGMTLTTAPEDIYRALLEAAAYGLREIRDNYVSHGVAVDEIYACGGIPKKNPLLMQIYADVCGCDIKIAKAAEASALGAAVFASVAAGKENGGYDTVSEAAEAMGHIEERIYHPIPENVLIYDKLFAEFKRLHDYFGTGINDVMKRLKKIREEAEELSTQPIVL